MIKHVKLSLDLVDNAAEPGVLDTEHFFPVISRPTIQSKPDFTGISLDDTKLLAINLLTGHIISSDVTTCHIVLANWDYSEIKAESAANKKVRVINNHHDMATFPSSTSLRVMFTMT
jgi:hypothetical protein